MSVYFTSDLHFGHANIIKYCDRPFSSLEEMNNALIQGWNEVVNPEDTIYCLGDFSLSFNIAKEVTPILNGRKILVPGNHDKCFPRFSAEKNERLVQQYKEIGWTEVTGVRAETEEFTLSHFPYRDFSSDSRRFEKFRPMDTDKDRWLLHGHTHDNKSYTGPRMIHVGVDAWNYRPVGLDKLLEIKQNGSN